MQIFNVGTPIIGLKIYDKMICVSTFKCQDIKTFNKENLSSKYPENFLKGLFDKDEKEIIHKDDKNNILIKIIKD